MAYSRSYQIPTANTEGSPLPPSGTTGKYLWEDTRIWRSNQLLDEPGYPGQTFCLRETVQLFYSIYDGKLISERERWYEPKFFLGNWQSLPRSGNSKVLKEGNSRYLVTTLTHDNWFVLGYKLEDGFTDYGRLKISQCNFSLEPSSPISIEIAGVELEFASYEVPSGRGTLFKGEFSSDRAYPRDDRQFQLSIGKLGLYTYQGASLTQISYDVRQINNCPGEAYPFQQPTCPKF